MHDGGDRDLIALPEEAGKHQPHHQVFAHNHLADCRADLGIRRDAPRGGAPCRQ